MKISVYVNIKVDSMVNSIANLTKDIFYSINNSKSLLAAFIDLKKAFDIVNHDILIYKLKCMGIRDKTLQWLKSHLNNRYQRTICYFKFSKMDKKIELSLLFSV